jgi:dTDP-glucose 4,6-dehydratase
LNILVTGGLGFIGSNFILNSINDYDKITNIDSMSYGSNIENLRAIEGNKRYTFVKGDIADKEKTLRYTKEVNAIINFAAETHVDRSIADPAPFVHSNILGTYTLLEAARLNDVEKFVQVSTDEVYGSAEMDERPFKEDDRLNPSNPYSATKAAAEFLVLAYHKTYGIRTIVTRCTNNFGPFQYPEKLIPKTIIRAVKGLKIPVYSKGEQVRSWIYVLDHVNALKLVLNKGRSGEVYNITAWNEKRNRDVVSRILSLLGFADDIIEYVEDRPGHDFRYSVDPSKIQNELSWAPKYKFEEALRETVEWYLKNRDWWEPLVDERTLHPTPWKLR